MMQYKELHTESGEQETIPCRSEGRPGENMTQEKQEDPAMIQEGYVVPKGYRLVRETKNKRLQLLTTPTIAENLKAAAVVKGLSVNELCNRIFEDYLRRTV